MLGGLIWWILVGLVAGWAAGRIMKGSGYGPLMDIVLGIVGAIVGGWLLGALGTTPQERLAPLSSRLSARYF